MLGATPMTYLPRAIDTKNLFLIAAFFLTIIMTPQISYAEAERKSCDLGKKKICEDLVQDNILWRIEDPDSPASKHWAQKNLDKLCACTNEPYETVNCFQVHVNNNHKTWQEAISLCSAKTE